jgi:N-acetylneuraminate synthase
MNTARLQIIEQSKQDAAIIKAWRLHPSTIAMSFRQKKMTDDEFWAYFQTYFLIKDLPPLFAIQEGVPVGFVGFTAHRAADHPHRLSAELSIMIDPEKRGKGLGTSLLQAASAFAKQQGYDDIYAKIKPSNTPSIAIFEKNGFEYIHEVTQIVEEHGQEDRIPARLFVLHLTPMTDPNKVFIIGEAGSNWRMGTYARDLKMAKELIVTAKNAGCDAVKFQTYRPETVYVANAGKSGYLETDEDISDVFQDLQMPYEMIRELAAMASDIGIEFMSTPFSI